MTLLQITGVLEFLTLTDLTTNGLLLGICWYFYTKQKKLEEAEKKRTDELIALQRERADDAIKVQNEVNIALLKVNDTLLDLEKQLLNK